MNRTIAELGNLEIQRARMLNSAQAAEFWGVSLPHWRRLYREGKVPRGLHIGKRKLGWRVGDLIDAPEVSA